LLTPCPDEPNCWIYIVRSGDNLVSIARYFGVPLDVVRERNPWTETTGLVAGQELRLPPPTR
jgi:LysM repeat protein